MVGSIGLCLNFLLTKIFFSNARIIRWPIYIRGRKYIKVGHGFTTGRYNRIDAISKEKIVLRIGENVQINDRNHIAAALSVKIGDDVLIASGVFISDHNHGKAELLQDGRYTAPISRALVCSPVEIGNCVWIGENVSILPGVKIGDGAIVGAGAVVTKNVNPGAVVVGNPAKEIVRVHEA